MTPNHTTKASDWLAARTAGQRLAEHVLEEEEMGDPTVPETPVLAPESAIGGVPCDLCQAPMQVPDFCIRVGRIAGLLVCTQCIEDQLEALNYERTCSH